MSGSRTGGEGCCVRASAEAAAGNRILGTDGVIEIGGPAPIRVLRGDGDSDGWERPDLSDIHPRGNETTLSVLDLISCLKDGGEPAVWMCARRSRRRS